MRCINNSNTDIYFNLAAEEYLIKNASEAVFMLWQNEPCVVIGRHQDIRAEANLDFIRENEIKIARRYSGGGTVYQDEGNLNLTFIEFNGNPDFEKYTLQMLEILSKAGIQAQADARRGLYIDGKKISGSAQYIRGNKTLYHATLLYSTNLNKLTSTLETSNTYSELQESSKYVKSVKSAVTNITDHLTYPLSIDEFKKLIINYFINETRANSFHPFSQEEITAINHLKQEKYATPSWNFQAKQ